jgi:DNA-binding transcriptional LysR family regulator
MNTLTSINVFRQVVELGSFVRAAEQLDLSTAMVSKHVMAIEKRLGVKLLNRNSHKLSLTEPGRFYFERCKGILNDLQETELELESFRSAPRGTLRIACCDGCVPTTTFASVLAEYRLRYPDVILDISFLDRAVDLVEEGYDVAFRVVGDEQLPQGIVARRVRPLAYRLAASRGYLEQNGVPKVPEDLTRHDFIAAGGIDSLSLQGPQGLIKVPLRVALRCRTMADVAITVAGGMGMALLPATLFKDPAFMYALRPVLTEYQPSPATLYLLYPDRKYLPFKARAFIDLAVELGARTQDQQRTLLAGNSARAVPEERTHALAV